MVKKCLSRMSGKLSRTVLRRGKGSNPFSLVDFTNKDYIELLQTEGIKISMDGKGRALDNIFVERFFRTLKYENIYLNEYETPKALRRGLNQYIRFYNEQRLHESLGYRCPVDYYRQTSLKLAI